ncbi:hypothetical protein D0469_09620 [Peribacillus saganii]|uniref:Uncharacterized protein n=1 Tax=Peribacillus saganii TaxID=2303992 RepID=A0A372LP32_9BACI|nr:hypothetical protein [Peribacillus saganii]RFU69466.1 hypothetical protein D0469_09620 [Peribacillus saganii]
MALFLVGIIYWSLVAVSGLWLVWGLWKNSWKAFMISGYALLLPALALYFGGAEGWFKLPILLPIVIFVIAYRMKNR